MALLKQRHSAAIYQPDLSLTQSNVSYPGIENISEAHYFNIV